MSDFLSEKWLRKKIAEFGQTISAYHIAALLHIYLGTLSLEEISDEAGLSREFLSSLRAGPRFMSFVDSLKKECSKEFRETLLVNDYLLEEGDRIGADFSMLDEMVQMQIKVPLITQLDKLSQQLKSRKTYGVKIETHELVLFKRLFVFFIFSEKYTRVLTAKTLSDIKQVAGEIVWPALKLDLKEIDGILNDPLLTRERRVKELKARLAQLRSP